METVPVNYLAIVIAAFASMVLGFAWYGPLFGTQWVKLMGWKQQDVKKMQAKGMSAMTNQMVIAAVTSLVMAYVLAHSIVFASTYTGVSGMAAGLMAGFWSWLGFVMPVTASNVIWEGRKVELWAINNGYYLVSLMVMGVILAMM